MRENHMPETSENLHTPNDSQQEPGTPHKLNPWITLGLCLFIAFTFLLIASKSSPLYPINDWTDANTFFTVGKGMFNGRVPYLHLFEQKGPLLYFIFGLGYLVSHTTFLGVFIFEALSFAVFLYFSHRLIALFVGEKYSLIALPLLAAAVLNLRSFGHGGSAEQFTLPLFAISIYYLVHYFKITFPQPMPPSWLFLNGVVAGCVLWIKYSFVGFWAAWIGAVLVSLLLQRKYLGSLKAAAIYLGGMASATLPWLVYFGFHGAIRDWFHTYFVINLTSYPMDLTLRERIMVPIDSLQRHLAFNPLAVSLLLLGVIVLITNRAFLNDRYSRLGLFAGVVLLALGVYGGGRDYVYYFFIFAPFITFGFIVLLSLYHQAYPRLKTITLIILVLFSLLGAFGYTLRFQRNTYMLSWDRSEQIQYRYARLINQTDNATLLNYGSLDSGFYTAAGITPTTKYFQQYNIDYGRYPHATDEQNRYIKNQEVDFLIIQVNPAESGENLPIPYLYENYELVADGTQLFGETEFKYLLFSKLE